jgi:hypothetical protein
MQGAAASRNLMLCFEEIAVQNIILKAGKDSSVFPISIEAEFSEQKGTLTMNFAWGGNEFKTGHGRGRPLFRHNDQAFQGH